MSERKKYIEDNKIITNFTTIFLLPMIGYDRSFYPDEFISAYIIDDEKPKMAIVFENSDTLSLKACLQVLENNREFVSMDYDDDNKEVVIIVDIPKYFTIDFNMFKIGRYTKFSNAYKEILLDVHGRITGEGKRIMMVDALFPDKKAKEFRSEKMGVTIDELPNGEVMPIFSESKEIYKTIKQLLQIEEQ